MFGGAVSPWRVGIPVHMAVAAFWLAGCATAPAPPAPASPEPEAAAERGEPGEPGRDDFRIDVPHGWAAIPEGPAQSEDALFEVYRGDYGAIVRVFVSGRSIQTIGAVADYRRSRINENDGVARISERRFLLDEESMTPAAWLESESRHSQGTKWRSWSLIIPHDGRVWEIAGYAERDLYFVETERLVSSFRFVQ